MSRNRVSAVAGAAIALTLSLGFAAGAARAEARDPTPSLHGANDFIAPRNMPVADPNVGPESTCEAIYTELSRLVPYTRNPRQEFFGAPINAAASVMGTFFPPAYLLMLVPEYAAHVDAQELEHLHHRIDQLRQYSSSKRCWVN